MTSSAPIVDRIRIIPRPDDFLDRNVGSSGEVFFNKVTNSLRVYSGKDVSGFEIARADLNNVTGANLLSKLTITNDDISWIAYAELVDLPSAADNHGMFAHVHGTGKAYYAHAGTWIELANQSDINSIADISELTDTTNLIPTDLSNLTDTTNLIPATLTDLGITDGDSTQILTTDGAGNFTFEDAPETGTTQNLFATITSDDGSATANAITDTLNVLGGTNIATTIATDTDNLTINMSAFSIDFLSDVDTTSSAPATGNVLKWDGAKWAPGTDATTGGSGTDADTLDGFDGSYYLDWANVANKPSILTLASLSVGVELTATGDGAISYDNTSGEFRYTPPDLSTYLTSVPAQTFASLTSKPTTLSGYGITDAQATLVSATNIKTINGTSLLGSGNIAIAGGSGVSADPEYNNGAIIDLTGDGSNFFSREVTVNGVRIVAAGAVGGQTAVPDAFVEKVARMFELFTDVNGAGINEASQRTFIKTLSGDAGTYHAAVGPTLQRVARGAGSDYTPNFLTDSGIASYNLSPLFDSHVANDMVWYLNSTGDAPGDGDNDAQEVIEHVFHTLHMHGLDAVSLKMYSYISADWASGPLYAAMEEAYDAGKWDSSGYGGNAWKTDGDAFEVAAKEYLFLLNFGMFEYSSLWDGGSLSPEWTDDMRTQSGIQANNPLGYALHNTYIAPVISKPSLTTIRSIFQDGDTGNPTLAGASGYVVDNYTPIFSNNIGAVQYNSDINQFAGRRNSGVKSVLGGLYSDDYQTFVRPNSDNTINFTTQGVNVATMSYQATTLNRLELGGIDIDGNTIQTNTTNSDLILAPEIGQGKVQFENLHFLDNTITNTSNGAALFNVTGDGYIKLNQPTAFVIPAGSTVQRPSNPQVGELRRNSDLDYLEVYTVGGIWSDASGSGETVSEDEMNNIMNEYILIFG